MGHVLVNRERMDATEALRAAVVRAEKESHAKDQLLATVTHEIRTPMNGVIGMVELLLLTGLDDEQREMVSVIASSGSHLIAILSDILDIAKIEAGKLELEYIEFDLLSLVRDVMALTQHAARANGIEAITDIAADVPHAIVGDPTRLRQILTNLMNNAVKFTDEGAVSVAVSVETGAEGDRRMLRFEVTDTGIGIPHDEQGGLFQPFTQANASHTRRYGGTGLGLAICKRIAHAMEGDIGLRSRAGQGSTFWVTIPFDVALDCPSDVRERPAVAALAPSVLAARILLVEDNPVNQCVARKLLAKLGFVGVDVAADGMQALDLLRIDPHAEGKAHASTTIPYDIILMDLQLPGIDGFELTGIIRRAEACGRDGQARTQRIPIIAMSAQMASQVKTPCRDAGMDDFVCKPISGHSLSDTLGAWLGNRAHAWFDGERGVQKADGDPTLFARVCHAFLDDAPQRMRDVRNGVEARDAASVMRAAASLNGAAACVCSDTVSQFSASLERVIQDERWDMADQMMPVAEAKLDVLLQAIKAWLVSNGRADTSPA
jgi:CheY-like chemotaxis protein